MSAGIAIARRGAAGILTLDGAERGNALTAAMRAAIASAIPGFARDPDIYALAIHSAVPGLFCAGSDLSELVACVRSDPAAADRALGDAYALCWLLECFSKPTVSLIDAPVIGGGVGLTLYSTHRVAAEGYRLALPATAAGFFPDDGVAHAFARIPGGTGLYLALTGRSIGRADAYRLGLVTHCLPARAFEAVLTGLAAADPVDPLLDALHADPGPGELEALAEPIARAFLAPDLPGILAALAAEGGPHRAWAQAVTGELLARSPTALAVTLAHLQAAAGLDLKATLERDWRIAVRSCRHPDLAEGVRAGRDGNTEPPRWRPASIEDLAPGLGERMAAPLETAEGRTWSLPSRQEMQSMRV